MLILVYSFLLTGSDERVTLHCPKETHRRWPKRNTHRSLRGIEVEVPTPQATSANSGFIPCMQMLATIMPGIQRAQQSPPGVNPAVMFPNTHVTGPAIDTSPQAAIADKPEPASHPCPLKRELSFGELPDVAGPDPRAKQLLDINTEIHPKPADDKLKIGAAEPDSVADMEAKLLAGAKITKAATAMMKKPSGKADAKEKVIKTGDKKKPKAKKAPEPKPKVVNRFHQSSMYSERAPSKFMYACICGWYMIGDICWDVVVWWFDGDNCLIVYYMVVDY